MLRLFPLIVFLVILLGVCAPRSVDASCGDWLEHAPPVQSNDQSGVDDHAENKTPAVPCDGPLCQQSPSGPGPLPASPSTERNHHDVAWMRPGVADDDALDTEWFAADGLILPSGHKMGIERPPQS